MNTISPAFLFCSIASFFIGGIILNLTYAKREHYCWLVFCVSVGLWSLGLGVLSMVSDLKIANLFYTVHYLGAIFIPVSFLAFIRTYFLKEKFLGVDLILAISTALVLYFILGARWLLAPLTPKWNFTFYTNPGPAYPIFVIYFFAVVIYCFVLLFLKVQQCGRKIDRGLLFFIVATSFGYIGGSTAFLLVYDIPFPPYGIYLFLLFPLITSYAILKHRLMDIKVAVTRVGIFTFVYILVLGFPFLLFYKYQLANEAIWLMLILATAGPYINTYLRKQAENKLFEEQRAYQNTLRQASMGMGQIKELGRLLKLIVHIVSRAVALEHCEIYLLHEDSNKFTLKASRGWVLDSKDQLSVIDSGSVLVKYLKEIKESVVFEEVEQFAADYGGKKLVEIKDIIRQLDGALVVPSFMDQKLIAILVLGKKKSGKIYTQDDMAVFSILANQAGLAIENAQFYEKMKETHKQLLKAEKMATIGTMADGLSHQLNNRLHAMGFIAGDALDTLKLKKKEELPPDLRQLFDEIEHSLKRIEDNVKRGGEIVEGLLKYTRKGSEGFEAINLNSLLDASLEMAQYKIKLNAMRIERHFDDMTPKVKGNFTQLQEVFFNLIDNAYDAMMQRKEELKEPGYQPNLEISAQALNGKLQILIQDNGMGVKKEDMGKLFTPFFTTKLSSKKGTGLGLYVIRQIIEENHDGRVRFTSKYRQGSQTSILLPIAH